MKYKGRGCNLTVASLKDESHDCGEEERVKGPRESHGPRAVWGWKEGRQEGRARTLMPCQDGGEVVPVPVAG